MLAGRPSAPRFTDWHLYGSTDGCKHSKYICGGLTSVKCAVKKTKIIKNKKSRGVTLGLHCLGAERGRRLQGASDSLGVTVCLLVIKCGNIE